MILAAPTHAAQTIVGPTTAATTRVDRLHVLRIIATRITAEAILEAPTCAVDRLEDQTLEDQTPEDPTHGVQIIAVQTIAVLIIEAATTVPTTLVVQIAARWIHDLRLEARILVLRRSIVPVLVPQIEGLRMPGPPRLSVLSLRRKSVRLA